MSVQEVEVGKLVFESKLYPRMFPSEAHIRHLAESLRAGETFPPVTADDQRFILIDGVHRVNAWKKVYGEDAKIPCDLITAHDAEIFRLAVEYNSAHGLGLTPFEETKCLLRFTELGITRDVALRALRITAEKAERMVQTKTAFRALPSGGKERIPLKGTMHNFRGETLNKKQEAVNRTAGGLRPHYYLDQLIGLVEAGLCERATEGTLRKLYELRDLLVEELPKGKKKVAAA
jgi:ParB/Sulfiredoxin domain